MAINMMCMNSECKHYWEDNCMKNINEERIEIDENGKCETFEKGISDLYNPSGLRVYFDGDSEWYASPWDLEKTRLWIIKEFGLDDDLELEECNIDMEGMWYETNNPEDIAGLDDYDESCKGGIGDLRRGIEDKSIVERLMAFREVIKLQGASEKPYIIATTNY